MMNILIFDMDGVLLQPQGYHRALKETVRLAGISAEVGDVLLTDDQIAQFEALGISSEWHSSALCMALITLHKQQKSGNKDQSTKPVPLDLEELFEAIDAQPMYEPALKRGLDAIEKLAAKYDHSSNYIRELVAKSDSIHHSPTMNWFQELILGSAEFQRTYQKSPQFQQESYLKLYDQPLISKTAVEKIIQWASLPDHGAAIMTNRPSNGPLGFDGAPDAEMGAELVGLENLPLIGYGEIVWLAEKTAREVGELSKPGWPHALTTILAAGGWSIEECLAYVRRELNTAKGDDLNHLRNSMVTVFEDTPGGILSVQQAVTTLNEKGLKIEVQKIGVAKDAAKQSALSAQGADIYPDINQALADLNNFRAFPSD